MVAPDTELGILVMKKSLLLLLAGVILVNLNVLSQKKVDKGEVIFEEATAREAYPNVAVFVFPQICDLKMLETTRIEYGPFEYPLSKDLSSMTDAELSNCKTRALQQSCKLAGADLIIEPLYTSTTYSKDNKTISIKISGYPAKYINFRSLSPADMKMIETLYPHGVENIQRQNSGNIITTAQQGAK